MKKCLALVIAGLLSAPALAQSNQWTNMGGWLNATRGWLDWSPNSRDGRYCLFSGAPRWNGADNAVFCWNAATNQWEQTFVNDNSSTYPTNPKGGDEAAWFWNPQTQEYVTLDMAQFRPQAYAFSMITRRWRPIGDADISGISQRAMPFGSGSAYSPDHNVAVITHGGQYVPMATRIIDFNVTPPTYREIRTGLPPARVLIQNMFLYVSSLRKFLLWGGWGYGAERNDLWLLDPVTWQWTQVAQVNPPPGRDNAMLAYDSVQNVVYLHGGELPSGQSEGSIVWILDLNKTPYTWMSLPVPAGTAGVNYPYRRNAGVAVFDPGRGFCVTAGYLQGAPNWWDSLSTWCFKHKLTADTTPPQVPGGGSGSFIPSSLGDLPVSWSRSPSDTGVPATTDVVRYEVMRSQDGGSTWIDAQVVTATGAAGYSYTYRSVLLSKVRVRAVDSSNNASSWVVLF